MPLVRVKRLVVLKRKAGGGGIGGNGIEAENCIEQQEKKAKSRKVCCRVKQGAVDNGEPEDDIYRDWQWCKLTEELKKFKQGNTPKKSHRKACFCVFETEDHTAAKTGLTHHHDLRGLLCTKNGASETLRAARWSSPTQCALGTRIKYAETGPGTPRKQQHKANYPLTLKHDKGGEGGAPWGAVGALQDASGFRITPRGQSLGLRTLEAP